MGRQWRAHGKWRRFAAWTSTLGRLSLAWLSLILLGVVLRPVTGVPWWQFVPLGLVECALAITEVAAVVVLGWWAWRAAGVTTPTPIPADLSVRAGAGKPEPCHRFRISR